MRHLSIRRLVSLFSASALVATLLVASLPGMTSASAATCTQTGFFRDGINMTAAQIGGNVTGSLDAGGCNIGVYYDSSTAPGNVTSSEIFGANYFGVVVRGTTVNVSGSNVHDIGESPLNGSQHGIAIYYATVDTGAPDTGSGFVQPSCTSAATSGNINGNTVTHYQKAGIVTNCAGTTATVSNNTVTGEGAVSYIAQNGIQVGYGAKATITGNNVSGNAYSGANNASSAGVLVVGGPCFGLPYTIGLSITKNTLTNNDVGVWLFNADLSCSAPTIKTNNSVKLNTITNAAVTNTTGYSPICGYQAGVADVGHRDLIVNNSISGFGYTMQTGGDCTGTPPAFLRFVDLDSSARGVPSNK